MALSTHLLAQKAAIPGLQQMRSAIALPRPSKAGCGLTATHLRVLRMKQKILESLLKRCVRIWRCSGLVAPSNRTYV